MFSSSVRTPLVALLVGSVLCILVTHIAKSGVDHSVVGFIYAGCAILCGALFAPVARSIASHVFGGGIAFAVGVLASSYILYGLLGRPLPAAFVGAVLYAMGGLRLLMRARESS